MNAIHDGEKTRFDKAVTEACDYVKALRNGTGISVISSSDEAVLVVSSSEDKDEVIEKIKEIKPTMRAGSTQAGVEMVKTMQAQWPSLTTVCFTDTNVDMEDVSGYIVDVYKEKENVGINYLSHGNSNGKLVVLAKVTNYGKMETAKEVTLYGDDQIITSQSVSFEPGESKIVYFDKVNFGGSVLRAELNGTDSLMLDNICYDIVSENKQINILLMTEKNAYIEKALDLMEGITVTKSNDIASFDSFVSQKYDLYIFDCMMPANFPENGNVIIFDAPNPNLYKSKGVIDGALVKALPTDETRYIENMDFGAANLTAYVTPSWAYPFLVAGTDDGDMDVAFSGEKDGQKITVFGFDVHNSELPLKMEFPLLMYNIINDNVTTGMLTTNVVNIGDGIQINAKADKMLPVITKPDASEVSLSDYRIVFTGTDEVGVYSVTQSEDRFSGEEEYFAANFPSSESFVESVPSMNEDQNTEVKKSASADLDLKNIVIVLILLLLGVEWIAYLRK